MTTQDFILALFCQVDQEMTAVPNTTLLVLTQMRYPST